jgi:hypothetical protein
LDLRLGLVEADDIALLADPDVLDPQLGLAVLPVERQRHHRPVVFSTMSRTTLLERSRAPRI